MKDMLNVTDVISYLYCPRILYLKKVLRIKEKTTKQMIKGKVKHEILNLLNRNEKNIIIGINKKLNKEEIKKIYRLEILKIINEVINLNKEIFFKYNISKLELIKEIYPLLEKEIQLRISPVEKMIKKGYLELELWEKLPIRYFSEIELFSKRLLLKGRIDRIEINKDIIPYEIKTKKEVYLEDKLQLTGYCLLLEEKFNREINYGFIETENENKKIEIDNGLKNEFLKILSEVKKIINEKKEIPINSNFKKCVKCNFKNICFSNNLF